MGGGPVIDVGVFVCVVKRQLPKLSKITSVHTSSSLWGLLPGNKAAGPVPSWVSGWVSDPCGAAVEQSWFGGLFLI